MIKKDTKVAVLGAGAMGCLFGGLLSEKGLDVVKIIADIKDTDFEIIEIDF